MPLGRVGCPQCWARLFYKVTIGSRIAYMGMSIKNDEAERLTRELAAATGESLTTALTIAVRERLDRVTRQAPTLTREERAARIVALGRPDALPEPWASTPHGDLLYDELGLPR